MIKLVLLAAASAAAQEYSSWVVWWDRDSLPAFEQHQERFQELVVFGWRFSASKRLVAATPAVPDSLRRVKDTGKRVYVSALNDLETATTPILKDPATVHEILSDPAKRAVHLEELVTLAEQAGGLEMDYENLWAIDRTAYAEFIRDLGARIRPRGKGLAVVVQQRTNNVIRDGAGAMDWAALSAASDHLKIMCYNQHGEGGGPGPVASPDWVERIVTFALQTVPRRKLVAILPLHGFDWPAGGRGRSIEWDAALALARAQGVEIQRDADGTPHFTYTGSDGLRHDVWFEDSVSVLAKVRRLHQLGVHNIGFWRLGTGDPAIWEALPTAPER